MVWLTTVCTEREFDGVYEDCAWASAVMLQNEAYGKRVVPQTQAEYEALRLEGGDPATPGDPGSNVKDVLKGFLNRYGWQPARLVGDGWAELVAKPAGTAFEMSGLYSKLPARLRRWSTFTGPHAIAGVKTGAHTYWWLDPLAPKDYPGEVITEAELRAFHLAVPGTWVLVVTVGSRTEESPDMPYQYKAERWLLDGGPAKVTTLGAPFKADGSPDFSKRLALTSGTGGTNPRLTEIARTRLTAPTDELTEEFFTALATYTLPTAGGTATFNAGVEAAAIEALTAKR